MQQQVWDNCYIRIFRFEFDVVVVECHTSKEELIEDLSQIAYEINQNLHLKKSNVGFFLDTSKDDVEIVYDMYGNVYLSYNFEDEELLNFICTIIKNLEKK